METIASESGRKRAIRLEVSAKALDEAEAAGLDIALVLEDAMRDKARPLLQDAWRAENRAAVAWHNALVERMGGTLHEVLAQESAESASDAV
jgi:post-segregation antitoxin (ccd killing protein)